MKRKHEFILGFFFFFSSTYGQGNHNLVKQEIKRTVWDFLGGSVVKTPVLLMQVGLVQSMVGKLRSHMLHVTVKKRKEREKERELFGKTQTQRQNRKNSLSHTESFFL